MSSNPGFTIEVTGRTVTMTPPVLRVSWAVGITWWINERTGTVYVQGCAPMPVDPNRPAYLAPGSLPAGPHLCSALVDFDQQPAVGTMAVIIIDPGGHV